MSQSRTNGQEDAPLGNDLDRLAAQEEHAHQHREGEGQHHGPGRDADLEPREPPQDHSTTDTQQHAHAAQHQGLQQEPPQNVAPAGAQRHADADPGYSRVHHRILFFIGRHPGCSINELLAVMRVTKQYLHRPLQRLIQDAYVTVTIDKADQRIKRLHLSKRGTALEDELSGDQRRRFQRVFERAGPQAEAGWKKVMALLAHSAEVS